MLETPLTAPISAALLISADELAGMLGCSPTHVWRMHSGGKLPKPMKLGRLTRWRDAEVRAWIEAGAPPRASWYWQPEKGGCRCAGK